MESGTKTKLYESVSQIACVCVSFVLVLNVHIPLYLGSRKKPFFRTYKFFIFSSSFNYISLYKFCELPNFYFRSLLTLHSVSMTLISPMWHSVILTLFPKFRYLDEKMFRYLDEKMYLGRLLFPLAKIVMVPLWNHPILISKGENVARSNRFWLCPD
jgi:hypothetical protein